MANRPKDALGARMKANYETRTRTYLPRRTYTVLRLDGKAFHTYTKGLERPFDAQLSADMAATAAFVCKNIDGTRFGYTQSDEISILVTDFTTPTTEAWFDGNVQKITSVAAALATAKFNELRPGKLAVFDARVFTIPDPIEVANYFIWRQQDATRNSVAMAAQAHFSHNRLHGLSCAAMQALLFSEAGINWNDYPEPFKRGALVYGTTTVEDVTYIDKRTGEQRTSNGVTRTVWGPQPTPVFTRSNWLAENIPPAPTFDM